MPGERVEPDGFIPSLDGVPDVALIPVAGFGDNRTNIVLWRTAGVLAYREIAVRVPRRYGLGAHGERLRTRPPDKNVSKNPCVAKML